MEGATTAVLDSALNEAARYVVERCMALKPGETVLVVTDDLKFPIGVKFYEAARGAGAETVMVVMKEREISGQEPPGPVAEAMSGGAQVILIPTTRSLSHTAARRRASAGGARIASMPGITEDMMARCLRGGYEEIEPRSLKLAEMLTRAKTARITSDLGTELVLSLDGRRGVPDTGVYSNPGDFGNLPAGEASIGPVEGSSHGVLVVDGSILGELADEPVRVTIKDGMAVKIEGGETARRLKEALDAAGPLAYSVAELGIGTNHLARLTGKVLEDEKILGTVHVAFGNNKSYGGNVDVPIHVDGVVLRPTLLLDDVVVIKKGRFLL